MLDKSLRVYEESTLLASPHLSYKYVGVSSVPALLLFCSFLILGDETSSLSEFLHSLVRVLLLSLIIVEKMSIDVSVKSLVC